MLIKPLNVLSLKCGTSLESFKCAFVKTDGVDVYQLIKSYEIPMPAFLRVKIDLILGKNTNNQDDKLLIDTVENDVTDLMIEIIRNFKETAEDNIDLIGIEGPTITHNVEEKYTYQLGKGNKIFEIFHIPTVSHFHNADMLNGGTGNPITATFYQALACRIQKPVLFIHIGGISSLTYIGDLGEMRSFDCGPGNAMLNDFMRKHAALAMDYNGKSAVCGKPDEKIIQNFFRRSFFEKLPPKAMPRDLFKDKEEHFEGLSLEDGAATITLLVVECIFEAVRRFLPLKPVHALVCGGGAKNPTMMRLLKQKMKQLDVETEIFDNQYVTNDATAIAFLAARRYYNLATTFPETTGVSAPMTGGKIYQGH